MVRNCSTGKMETTFYDDYSYNQPVSRDRDMLKRPMTLDLNPGRNAKKSKMEPGLITPTAGVTLSPVDISISTPELEKLIIGNPGLASATGLATTPSSFLFPKGVTEAQENYVQPFVQLLSSLHQSDSSSQGPAGAEASLCAEEPSSYTSLDSQYSSTYAMSPSDTSSTNTVVVIKDEPQTVPNIPCSPPVSPIDMECQEKIKLERKRQRNRVAASKCRKRKLERIALLEEKVKSLKGENAELIQVVHRLKDQVYQLKQQVVDHASSGCPILPQSV